MSDDHKGRGGTHLERQHHEDARDTTHNATRATACAKHIEHYTH